MSQFSVFLLNSHFSVRENTEMMLNKGGGTTRREATRRKRNEKHITRGDNTYNNNKQSNKTKQNRKIEQTTANQFSTQINFSLIVKGALSACTLENSFSLVVNGLMERELSSWRSNEYFSFQ